jgi:hypothetical protein
LKGSTQEQLEEMMTPEKYAKYKEISLPNAEKIVDAYHNFKTPGFRSNVLGDGSAAHKTASILHQLLNP